MTSDSFRSFTVMYQMEEGGVRVTSKIKTMTLKDLHRSLCAITRYQKPVRDWHTLFIHEHLEGGDVHELLKDSLVEFDVLYGFEHKPQTLALEHKKDVDIGGELTSKYVKRFTTITSILTDKSLLRNEGYAH